MTASRPQAALVVAFTSAIAATLSAAACSTTGELKNDRFEDAKVSYAVGLPGDGWKRLDFEKADIAWHNPDLGAGLFINSTCEGVQDSPLVGLTNELLIGTTEREVLEQELKPWSKREALETIVLSKLDGVLRKRALFVIKKDGCVYDIVYDAPPERFDAGVATYRRVRDGFDIGPRRDRGGA